MAFNIENAVKKHQGGIAFLVDQNGKILTVSDSAQHYHISAKDWVGKMIVDLFKISEGEFRNIPHFYSHFLNKKNMTLQGNKFVWSLMTDGETNPFFILIGQKQPELGWWNSDSEFFKKIINNLPQYIFWKDRNSIFLGCNENFARLVGLKNSSEIIGKTDYDFSWSKEQSDHFCRDDSEIIRTGRAKLFYEETQLQSDGKEHTVLVSKMPFLSDNEVIGLVCIYQDITAQKKAELDLVQSKKKAEAASLAKSEFIANISHDIRTPITGMLGLAQSLKDNAPSPDYRTDAELLIKTTKELLHLLNEVIEIVNLEVGLHTEQTETFSLRNICEHNVSLLRAAAKHKRLQFNLKIDERLPAQLRGNRIYIDRILLNLLSNAIKFTDEGSVSLEVRVLGFEQDEILVQFLIMDTGIGIPEDQFDVIFEHFSRLTPAYHGIYKGNGLGLYTVKKYLALMDGEITVKSTVGRGSTFMVNLPLKINGELHIEKNREVPNYLENQSAHILIVEDNPLAARMVAQIVKKCNCTCDVFTTGEEVLRNIQFHTYDLILMDIGLPDVDGIELTKHIHGLDNVTPIVALTGHMSLDKHQECVQLGMQDMIVKPLTLSAMQQLLNKYVFGKK